MTVDEAIAIAETILDGEGLNDVQELIIRQCWEGRCSYEEIAKLSKYDDEYIKSVAAKLWKQLSDALGEKVKKNNLQSVFQRYIRRKQIRLQQSRLIEVNLSGASLSGAGLSVANLSGAKLFTNLSETDLCQTDLDKSQFPASNIELTHESLQSKNGHNQGIQSNSEDKIYYWNDLRFRSPEQVKIAEALDRANILFFPNSKARLTTPQGRQNQEPDFLIFHQGKWGILEIQHLDDETEAQRTHLFTDAGIHTIYYCAAERCAQEGDRIVQEFLAILSQS